MTDLVIDDKDTSNFPLILTLQEEAIKILTSIYGRDSRFWKIWNSRKMEYMDAVKIEKALEDSKRISFDVYEDLADKKSAFWKALKKGVESITGLDVSRETLFVYPTLTDWKMQLVSCIGNK